jgi:hypothetical protein
MAAVAPVAVAPRVLVSRAPELVGGAGVGVEAELQDARVDVGLVGLARGGREAGRHEARQRRHRAAHVDLGHY